jgi:hypothetical protein
MVSPPIGGRNCRTSNTSSGSPFFLSVARTHTASATAPGFFVARATMSQARCLPVGSTYDRCLNWSQGVACMISAPMTLEAEESFREDGSTPGIVPTSADVWEEGAERSS